MPGIQQLSGLFIQSFRGTPDVQPKKSKSSHMELPNYSYCSSEITYYAPIRRGTSILLYPSNSYLRRDSAHPIQGFKSASNKIALTANIPVYTSYKKKMYKQKNKTENPIIENHPKIASLTIIESPILGSYKSP